MSAKPYRSSRCCCSVSALPSLEKLSPVAGVAASSSAAAAAVGPGLTVGGVATGVCEAGVGVLAVAGDSGAFAGVPAGAVASTPASSAPAARAGSAHSDTAKQSPSARIAIVSLNGTILPELEMSADEMPPRHTGPGQHFCAFTALYRISAMLTDTRVPGNSDAQR